MPATESLAVYWRRIQQELFPFLVDAVGPLHERDRLLILVLEMARVERFVARSFGLAGRKLACRASLARAFVAIAVYELPTTTLLVNRLRMGARFRRLCGWEWVDELPSEATFSRAFAEFAASSLLERAHGFGARGASGGPAGRPYFTRQQRHSRARAAASGRVARKAGLKNAREAAQAWSPAQGRRPAAQCRPFTVVKSPSRLKRQSTQSLPAMLADLRRACRIGTKQNAKGHHEIWRGYKLHIDVADGGIPISCILTSAHLHDSQAAIPLATMTASRVTSLYDLMDSAHDAALLREHSRSLGHIREHSRSLGHVP